MTEQEFTIKNALLALRKKAGFKLRVNLISSRSSNALDTTNARLANGYITLELVEPITETDLVTWQDAIAKAEALLIKLDTQIEYEKQNPDFFKALQAEFTYA